MTEIERIERLARWNRAEGRTEAARQLEALAESLRVSGALAQRGMA